MSTRDEGVDCSRASVQLLTLIAEILDCPISALYGDETCDDDRTIELLELWYRIKEDQDRLKVLGILRNLAGTVPDAGIGGQPRKISTSMAKLKLDSK